MSSWIRRGYPLQTLHQQFVSKSTWKLALFDFTSQCSRSPSLYVWWLQVACVRRCGLVWRTFLPGHFDKSLMPFFNDAALICPAGLTCGPLLMIRTSRKKAQSA